MKRIICIITVLLLVTTYIFSPNVAQAKKSDSDAVKYTNDFKKDHYICAYVTKTNGDWKYLCFEKNKYYYSSFTAFGDSLAPVKKMSIKLVNGKKITIKNHKIYYKNKVYTGNLTTKKTWVKPMSGKLYSYMKVKVKKGKIVSGKAYDYEYGVSWPG